MSQDKNGSIRCDVPRFAAAASAGIASSAVAHAQARAVPRFHPSQMEGPASLGLGLAVPSPRLINHTPDRYLRVNAVLPQQLPRPGGLFY